MIVGGRSLELSHEQVLNKMSEVSPEPIREHLVEMQDTVFPPKQVLAVVTGWPRSSFTTLEAQRVLSKVGFTCRRAGKRPDGAPAWVRSTREQPSSTAAELADLRAELGVAVEALSSLRARVTALESAALS